MIDTKPSYNLKVIVRETGIQPDTLRAWERRYNLPLPERTAGGHRLYSQRDLDTIKWLLAKQETGLSISRAVQLWRDLEAAGRDPLDEPATHSLAASPHSSSPAEGELARLREAWLRACLDFDEGSAEQQLGHALARHAPETVCLELIQKGLSSIGRLWYENQVTVQQEHFASALALRHVDALLAAALPPSRSKLIHLICPPQENHTFPLVLLALLLRYRGWPVAYLGANVPLAQMETTVRATRPALVILAAQTLPTAAEALSLANFYRDHQTLFAYGGYIFNQLPALRQQMPGYFLGEDLSAAATNVTQILLELPPMPTGEPITPNYRQALIHFDYRRHLLEEHVWQQLHTEGWSETHLQPANLHLSQRIRAALTLGDMNLVDHDLAWVKQLLVNYQIPPHLLTHYLIVYQQVAREQLAPACQPIIEWLSLAINRQAEAHNR